MKLSDYVARFLAQAGLRDVFLVSGGGIMHMLDSVGHHPDLRYHTTYHEQAAVVAAEGFARRSGHPAAVLVTVGPGAANAVSGLPGPWIDSIPMLVLAGNLRQDILADYTRARQYGPQEANTLAMARPVTKYAVSVRDPKTIRFELEKALYHATSGRPAPVWVELPLDVQGAEIDPETLPRFTAPPAPAAAADLAEQVERVVETLRKAERPMLVPGNGIRLAHAEPLLSRLVDHTNIPVTVPLTAKDLVAEDDPRYVGVFGTAGQRRANFAIQNSDCVLAIGAGLNVQKVGFNFAGFAPKAVKVIVDVDEEQLFRQAVKPDIPVFSDARDFLEELVHQLEGLDLTPPLRWREACARWKARYPLITSDYLEDPEHVNSYVFMDKLADATRSTDTIVPGAGLDTVSCYQAYRVKRGQRVLISAWGAMGWDLPLTIGACIGSGKQRAIAVTGDGSVQWNSQELMTIARSRLPVKIFVFNNEGFGSIRATQNSFFNGRYVGSDAGSGITNPNFARLAEAYGLRYSYIRCNDDLADGIGCTLADDEPELCEVNLAYAQAVAPKASAYRREDGTFESRPLEDMAPFLPREEIYENMHLFDEEPAST
jgi:acetolactate synthase I/II/III large subunit